MAMAEEPTLHPSAKEMAFSDIEDIVAYREEISRQRDDLEFDIDGLVVKGPIVNLEDMRRSRPEQQIAFKFDLEEAATTLLEVIWNPSGSLYTPIGVMEPVQLAVSGLPPVVVAVTVTTRSAVRGSTSGPTASRMPSMHVKGSSPT